MMTLVALVIIPLSLIIGHADRQAVAEVFQAAAGLPGARQRARRGNVRRAHGDESLQRRSRESVEKFDDFNNTLYDSAWKSQFLSGLMMPIMSFIGNLGYVAVAILGGYLAHPERHHRRRYPGLHPVRALVHPADHAARQHLQRPAADRGGRRAGLRVPGRGRGSARNGQPGRARNRDRAASSSRTSTSATARTRSSSTTSPPTPSPVRRSPSSVRPAPARPPWSSC